MHEVGNKIQDIISFLKERLPKSEGLVIRPELRKTVRKQARIQALKVYQKYQKLPLRSRRGPAAKDWRYRNRVGMKADCLRKVHIYGRKYILYSMADLQCSVIMEPYVQIVL